MENTIKNGKVVQDNELNRVTLTEDNHTVPPIIHEHHQQLVFGAQKERAAAVVTFF